MEASEEGGAIWKEMELIVYDLKTAEITPAGITYVCDNSSFEKTKEFLKGIKEIIPFI